MISDKKMQFYISLELGKILTKMNTIKHLRHSSCKQGGGLKKHILTLPDFTCKFFLSMVITKLVL